MWWGIWSKEFEWIVGEEFLVGGSKGFSLPKLGVLGRAVSRALLRMANQVLVSFWSFQEVIDEYDYIWRESIAMILDTPGISTPHI